MLPPFLGWKAGASLLWLDYVLPLAFVALSLSLALGNIDSAVVAAKRELLSACTGFEQQASMLASVPSYSASAVNQMTAAGANGIVQGLGDVTDVCQFASRVSCSDIVTAISSCRREDHHLCD